MASESHRSRATGDDSGSAPGAADQTLVAPDGALPTASPSQAQAQTEALLAGRYRIETRLGEGGMGVVYRAEHVLMKKTVAIKVLHPEMTQNREVVARFQQEAQAAAHIDHPNVCKATDFGQTEDGSFFLVIEYLEGQTLESMLKTYGQLTLGRALHICAQICDALTQAHSMGIVHRDLKPENIMLVDRDQDADFVKIMDFGIARVRMGEDEGSDDAPQRLTRAGMVYGTPQYMSPEQVVGAEIDHRADLYSVGVVLFEMITGRLPFEAESLTKLMGMHIMQAPPVPSALVPEVKVPAALDALIARLLSKEPGERPASAAEAREELRGIVLSPAGGLEATTQSLTAAMAALKPIHHQARAVLAPARDKVVALAPWTQDVACNAREKFMALAPWARAVLVGAVASMMCLAMIMVLVSTFSKPGQRASERAVVSLVKERKDLVSQEEMARAVELAGDGDFSGLLELAEKDPKNAHVAYLLGVAYADAELWTEALEAYDRSLDLDDRYGHDPRLNDDLFSRLESRTTAQSTRAREILVKRPNFVATERLAHTARAGTGKANRVRAREILVESGQFDKLEDWQRATIELRQSSGCAQHRENIEAIIKIGDKRALPTLELFDTFPRTGCGGILKRGDCYGCIRDDLARAIKKLDK